MTTDAPSDRSRRFGEAVAVVGVVVSLLFVGLQIRQNSAISSAQAAQDLAAMSQDFLLTVATAPEADSVWVATFFSMGDVTPAEQRRATYIMVAFLRRAESAFAQVERGLLPESALDAYGMAEITSRFDNPRFRSFWSQRRDTMRPAFVAHVEQRSGYQPEGGSP